MTKKSDLAETEVEIRYTELSKDIRNLARRIEQYDSYIRGMDSERQYRIRINDMYYAESVDKKTFIYTKTEVFRCELRLYELLEKVESFDFVQISKACIVNIDVIDSMQSLANSRLQVTLTNGEKVNVSRTFLPQIKAAFIGKEND